VDDAVDRLAKALADRYRVERALGEGGMATVYLAQDLKHDRKVALKVLRPDLAAVLGAERFVQEIKTTATLHHPNILPLFDSGEADGDEFGRGSPGSFLFYVMPYVEGETLRDKLNRETRLGIEEAVRITTEVADALDYAHRHNVIHRDIKPENILLQDGRPLVADFGIALAVSEAGGARLTETGLSLGTPAYMSPEQATGDRSLDGRSDCYALACVLYEMLSGDPPFVASSAQAIIARHVTDTAPPIATVRPDVNDNVSKAIARALSKAPADRFDSVVAFAAALTQSEGEAPADSKSIAVLPFANMSADPESAFFSDGMTEEIINALAQIPRLRVASRTSCFYFKGRSPEMAEVAAKLKVSNVLEGSVRRAGNRLRITVQLIDVAKDEHVWSERYDRTMDDVFAVQDEIATAIADRMRMSLGPAEKARLVRYEPSDVRAYELYLEGRGYLYQRGRGLLKGLQCMQQALDIDPDYPMPMAGVADAVALMGIYGLGSSAEYRGRTVDAAHRVVSVAPDLAEGHNAMACAQLLFEWDWAAAEASFRRAIELNPRYLQARAWYAAFYLCLISSRFEEGIEQCRGCVEDDPLSGYANAMYACCLNFAGRPWDALPFANAACSLDPDAFLTQFILQITHYLAGQWDESNAAAQTSLAVSGRHPWAVGTLCVCLADSGRDAEARALEAEMKSRAVSAYVQPFWLAIVAAAVGNADAAIAHAERAFDERDPTLALFGRNWKGAHHLTSDPRYVDILRRMKYPGWMERSE
jgi:serine/threonine protein kinase/tetratricopeptide (TPR) repeat protein